MTVQVIYKNKVNLTNKGVFAIFVDENFNFFKKNKLVSSSYIKFIKKALNMKPKKKKILSFDLSSEKTLVLVSVKKKSSSNDFENLGSSFYDFIKSNSLKSLSILSESLNDNTNNLFNHFLHGLKLKSYEFKKYKSKKDNIKIIINVSKNKNTYSVKQLLKFKALEEGTFYTRDLVSEPGNVLHPDEYAKRINSLKKYGLKINIYNEKKLKKLGMNALLGVGQGSIRGSYLVTIEWNGAKNKTNPLAFIGKGVCFDTGGYSLKPAKFMEDMTYDMAGSAVVVGLMKNLAIRKAKVNAVGVVGLVENMV